MQVKIINIYADTICVATHTDAVGYRSYISDYEHLFTSVTNDSIILKYNKNKQDRYDMRQFKLNFVELFTILRLSVKHFDDNNIYLSTVDYTKLNMILEFFKSKNKQYYSQLNDQQLTEFHLRFM